METKIFDQINKFRRDPTNVRATIQKLKTGIERLDPKNQMIKDYNNFSRTLHMIDPCTPLRYSEELADAAREYLEKNKKKPPSNRILVGDECEKVVPDNIVLGDYTSVFFHDAFDTPETSVIKLLIDSEDPDRIGRQFLQSNDITQVGIAVDEDAENDGENAMVVFIFSEDERYGKEDDETLERTGELWEAFKVLDTEDKDRIKIKEVCQALDDMGKDEKDPTLYNMLKELDDGKREIVTWKEFSEHFDSRFRDNKTDKGRREIFNVFQQDESVGVVDAGTLKKIRDTYNIDYTDDQIENMLKMNTYNKHGVAYEDYVERLEGKAKSGQEEEEE